MKASELYNKTTTEVDQLQKALHNHVRDQLSLSQDLATHQDRMKRLFAIMIQGDRELTGHEILAMTGEEPKALPPEFFELEKISS